ncbi:hypothetical protein ACER0C_002982 [Sarotherodon galilaeus]
MLPVVKASNKALLSSCNVSEEGCENLLSVVSSQSCSLRELDLSTNSLKASAVKLLSATVESPHAKLNILRLNICELSEENCEALSSVLSSQSCSLREMDLSIRKLQDSGVKNLSAGLQREQLGVQWKCDGNQKPELDSVRSRYYFSTNRRLKLSSAYHILYQLHGSSCK